MAATNLAPAGQEALIPVEELTGLEPVVHHAEALEHLRTLPDASVDAIVTDPPYELGFLGKAWDSSGIAYSVELWAECLRVLKPGGHLAAFGATRTYHRMAVAVEDAGFEIRDSLHWLYGSGFPKSLDVSKAIDKRREDRTDICRVTSWLADQAEPRGITRRDVDAHMGTSDMGGWWLSRLPHRCAVPTWEQWQQLRAFMGCGDEMDAEVWRLNGRKGTPGEAWEQREVIQERTRKATGRLAQGEGGYAYGETFADTAPATPDAARWEGWGTALKPGHEPIVLARKPLEGTVAGNVLAHGTGALNIDGCRVEPIGAPLLAPANPGGRWPANVLLSHSPLVDEDGEPIGDACADGCVPGCPVAELDAQSGLLTSGANPRRRGSDKFRDVYGDFKAQAVCKPIRGADSGGASRFYPAFRYQAKAPTSERPRLPDGTVHPTVKPVALMQWLVRLLTPPGGLVLDPFAGTGTTLEAARLEGFDSMGVEAKTEYAELCHLRLRRDTARST